MAVDPLEAEPYYRAIRDETFSLASDVDIVNEKHTPD